MTAAPHAVVIGAGTPGATPCIKRAAALQIPCVIPDNPDIHTINKNLFAGPLQTTYERKRARNTVIVSPGRDDRSPCGTGACSSIAVMHARGQLAEGKSFVHENLIGTEFIARIRNTTELAGKPANLFTIMGKRRITACHQYVLDPSDRSCSASGSATPGRLRPDPKEVHDGDRQGGR